MFQVFIGNAEYICLCNVRYVSTNLWMVVGLSVGCGLLFIVIIIVVVRAVIACRRRRKNKPDREERSARNDYVQGGQGSTTEVFELDDCNYWAIPADSAEIPPTNNNSVYYSARPDEPEANKEYTALGEPQPQQRQPESHQRQEYAGVGRPRFYPRPQPEPQSTSNNSPYYLSLKDDDEQ